MTDDWNSANTLKLIKFQFIIVLSEKDAVIVTTANISDMLTEFDLIWKYLPSLRWNNGIKPVICQINAVLIHFEIQNP